MGRHICNISRRSNATQGGELLSGEWQDGSDQGEGLIAKSQTKKPEPRPPALDQVRLSGNGELQWVEI